MPNLVVIAGPNGAGKTTTALALLREERRVDEFVNADIIAAEEGLDDVAAGRKMLRRISRRRAGPQWRAQHPRRSRPPPV